MFKKKNRTKEYIREDKRKLIDTIDYMVMILSNLLLVMKIARMVILNKKARRKFREEEYDYEYEEEDDEEY